MALALLRASLLSSDSVLSEFCVNTSKLLASDIQEAWDTSCCGENVGGIWWDKSHSQKATASNAGTFFP